MSDGPSESGPERTPSFVWDKVTLSPSGSDAEPVTETAVPVEPLTDAGAVMTGFRFVFAIVRAVVAAAVPPAPSFALQLTAKLPVWAALGVPVSVMLGFNEGPAEAGPERNGALFVWDRVTFWPSGSEAEPVIDTAVFSLPLTVAGAVMAGFRFVFAIVRAVVAAAVPAGVWLSAADQLIA